MTKPGPAPATPQAPTTALVGPTPAESEAFAQGSGRMSVSDYVPLAAHDGSPAPGKCEWTSHVALNLTSDEVGALAWVLIDSIMKARCGVAASVYDTWRQHTLAGTKLDPVARKVVAGFVGPVFGLPENDPKSSDHVQGHVGEWLWHLLTKDRPSVLIQLDPKGDVTDAGGDGYTIYEKANGEVRFRLWESKKNTGQGSPSSSLNKAYGQLLEDGQRYVAKIVGTFASTPADADPRVVTLITEVPAAWAQGDELIGAGVTLATHQGLPAKPFSSMPTKLPLLNKPGQLRGLATSIDAYVALAETVRRYAWTAL